MLDYSEYDLNCKFKEVEINQSQNNANIMKQDLKVANPGILSSPNESELEKKLISSSESEKNPISHNSSAAKIHKNHASTYNPKKSLFNLVKKDNRTNLIIFNTETEVSESKILKTPELLDNGTCITQLPDGKLFCFGNYSCSGVALLIDQNYQVKSLPSGTGCRWSSAICYNNNVYCFGGNNGKALNLSSRFELSRKEWKLLTRLPQADDSCNSVIFNGDILISGYLSKNLLRYSINNNSFTAISLDFAKKKRKILINEERLRIIECNNGSIYESEIGSDTAWRRIAGSTINFHSVQVFCLYNKGGIYIGCNDYWDKYSCFKFNLNEQALTKLV